MTKSRDTAAHEDSGMQDSPGYTTLLFRSLLNTLPDPVLIFDAEWRLLDMNPPAEKVFRASVISARTQPVEIIFENTPNAAPLLAFVRGERPLAEWSSDEAVYICSAAATHCCAHGQRIAGVVAGTARHLAVEEAEHQPKRIHSHCLPRFALAADLDAGVRQYARTWLGR
ncbi:MAG: PAS domain-containing protein [Blastochloris sp.]|nr:PAS domain-containing protein [Blastochloris sp.]